LAEERRSVHAKLIQSPFIYLTEDEAINDKSQQRENGEYADPERPWGDDVAVRVANEVPWVDLVRFSST
jgi:hypothetical protein